MTAQYFDTSALVKRYVDEVGSLWVRDRVDTATGLLLTSSMTRVEVACALARRYREGTLTRDIHDELWQAFSYDIAVRLRTLRINLDTLTIAERLAKHYPLRAYDAVHLATALVARQRLATEGITGVTFLSADYRLLDYARREGIPVENPLDHAG